MFAPTQTPLATLPLLVSNSISLGRVHHSADVLTCLRCWASCRRQWDRVAFQSAVFGSHRLAALKSKLFYQPSLLSPSERTTGTPVTVLRSFHVVGRLLSVTTLGSFCSKQKALATYSFSKTVYFKGDKMPLVPRSFDAHVVSNRVREQGSVTEFSKTWNSRQVAKENTKCAPSTFWRTKGRTLLLGLLFLKPDEEKIAKDLAVVCCLSGQLFGFFFSSWLSAGKLRAVNFWENEKCDSVWNHP